MDILTRGVERFEVIQVNEDRAFLQAEISVVQDEEEPEKETRSPDRGAGGATACGDCETRRDGAVRAG